MTVDIRLGRPDDRLNLVAVQRRASLASESGELRQRLLERPELIDDDLDEEMLANNEVLVAEVGDRLVGFAAIVAHEGRDAELHAMFVEPSEWRKGIGRKLIEACEREASAWGATRLRVVANPNAMAFYRAMGFEKVGEQKTELGPVAPLLARPIPAK